MLRLFLTLYGVLALTLGGFIVALEVLPERLLRYPAQDYYERVMRGAFHLVEERLAGRQEAQWGEVIAELQPHFAYPIVVKEISEEGFGRRDRERLARGRVVFDEVDGAVHLYKRIGESDRCLSVAMEQTRSQANLGGARGTAYLIMEKFLGRDPEEWPDVIQELQGVFGIPLSLHRLEDADVPEASRSALQRGELLVFDDDEPEERYYQRIGDTTYVLKAGPIGLPFVLDAFVFIVLSVLAVTLALAVYLWVRPIWRDLSALDRSAGAFGRGELAVRVTVSSGSAVAQLAGTFNGMAARIQRLIRSHKDLTNAVSHELRTPIARLRFGIEMMQGASDDETRLRHLQGMQADVDDLDSLVSELLSYARFDRETPRLEFKRQPVLPWLHAVVEHARLDAGDIAIEWNRDHRGDYQAAFEPRLMSRAIGNLLRNAARYARSRVEVAFVMSGGECRLSVDDDGPGIPAADRERILEPFTRIDASRDRASGGVGLGLAIARQVARWHGGDLQVADSPLGGARMVLTWPADGP